MKNSEVFEILDQLSGARIEKLVWIATAGTDKGDTFDMISKILDSECSDDVFPAGTFDDLDMDDFDNSDLFQVLFDHKIMGFLAEVLVPVIDDMSLKEDGSARSWSICGMSSIHYVYAETTDELVSKIKKISDDYFESCVKKAKQS